MDPLQYIRVLAEDNSKAKNIYSRSVTLAEELGRVGGAKRNSVSQRQIPYDFTHVWNLRSKSRQSSRQRERAMQGPIPGPGIMTRGQRQMLNQLGHPGTPKNVFFKFNV